MNAAATALALLASLCAATIAIASPLAGGLTRDAALESRIRVALARLPGEAGVAVVNLDTRRAAFVGADRPMPTASTYKLPIAVAVLERVAAGDFGMDDVVRLEPCDVATRVGPLCRAHPSGGFDLPVRTLLEAMLVDSDNAGCDALLRRLGGTPALAARVDAWGLSRTRLDETELEMTARGHGLAPPRGSACTARALDSLVAHTPRAVRARAARVWHRSPHNRTTAADMVHLLQRLNDGDLLPGAQRATLFDGLARSRTGTARLSAGLPTGVRCLHKSGTGPTRNGRIGAVNDVGLVHLPGGGGTVAIAVYLAGVRAPLATAEAVIAKIATAMFEQWNAPD